MFKSNRTGFTLIEMVVTLGVLSALASTSMLLMFEISKARKLTVNQVHDLTETRRFANTLRNLAHQASDVEVEPASQSMVLVTSDHRHRFQFMENSGIMEYTAEPSLSNDAIRQDRFTIRDAQKLTMEFDEPTAILSVTWEMRRKMPMARIEAKVGPRTNLTGDSATSENTSTDNTASDLLETVEAQP